MIPPHIIERFATVPDELTALCRPHVWEDIIRPPAEGMRSIRGVLLHTAGAETYWIQHVAMGRPLKRPEEASFTSLDAILAHWKPQREATLAYVRGLTLAKRAERRPFPWNPQEGATIEDIVWHVVTHEQYHRGQIFTRLAMLGRRDLPDHDLLR